MPSSVQPEFIDSHCHFDFEAFDVDRGHLWLESQKSGLKQLVMPGVAPSQWPRLLSLSQQLSGLYFAVGVHPYWLEGLAPLADSQQNQLLEYLSCERCVAIGECGMDSTLSTPQAVQQSMFEYHVQLACELNKPLIIHAHKAHHWVMPLLAKYRPPAGGVIHGFSGSIELASDYWSKGFYIGVGGTITYERARKTRDAVTQLPLAALLLETDAPDMPLSGFQGQRNSPLNVCEVAKVLAQLRGTSVAFIAEATSTNARQLFSF